MDVVSNVGCSILASLIYDVSKYFFGISNKEYKKYSIDKINEFILNNIDNKFETLYMSGEFCTFIQTPIFKDIIEKYIIYMLNGNLEGDMQRIKKNSNGVGEKEVIDFLLSYLFQNYYTETLIAPSKTLVRQFFECFFEIAVDYVVSVMKEDDKVSVFLINKRIAIAQNNVLYKLDETIETIKQIMKCEIIPAQNSYNDYLNEYHCILQRNHSRAHVYLLDTFDFKEFYVPPILRLSIPGHDNGDFTRLMKLGYEIDIQNKQFDTIEDYFDDWKHIFDDFSIVYVTGGAGYGKSLFLKKIINDYKEMNILNSSEYIVIYGDLKCFYTEGDQPASVVKFLQDSMVKETLMDRKCFSSEMIEYFIKMGRCIILLDALDEVEKQKREALHKKIISYFKIQNPNNKICITSRNRGFIPEKDVEVFRILPLNRTQIEFYVDNIIKLGRFDPNDKDAFLTQSSVLVDKGFLNSFLVLSLLINIYKAERELPENKMELYQKCFDYIAYRREKEKTKAKFDWNLISCMMKDNTFMELAKMCFPNNSDIGKDDIVNMLCKTYSGRFVSEVEAERAAEHFLAFCSDRTELFVPAAGEDRYKFFHRSFFEYFYAQYIFLRIREIKEVYALLQKFDVDSEIFELTLAMMKQKDEQRYQELVEYIMNKANEETKINQTEFCAFNIMTLGMQVIDDNIYVCRYVDYLVKNSNNIIKNIERIPNQIIIYSVISDNPNLVKKILESYESIAMLSIIETFLILSQDTGKFFNKIDGLNTLNEDIKQIWCHRFFFKLGNVFYIRVFLRNKDISSILEDLSENTLVELMAKCKSTKKTKERLARLYSRFKAMDEEKQKNLKEIILQNQNL